MKKIYVGVLEHIECDYDQEVKRRVEEVNVFSTMQEAEQFLYFCVDKGDEEKPSSVTIPWSRAQKIYRWSLWSDDYCWENREYSIFECPLF